MIKMDILSFIISEYMEKERPVSLLKIKEKFLMDSKKLAEEIRKLVTEGKIKEVGVQHYVPTKIERRPIIYNGRWVGELDGDVFYTKRGDIHIFNNFNSFNVSLGLINKLEKLGCRKIVFRFEGTAIEPGDYSCELSKLKNSKLEFNNKGDLQKCIKIEELVKE